VTSQFSSVRLLGRLIMGVENYKVHPGNLCQLTVELRGPGRKIDVQCTGVPRIPGRC
jgi:hypothetical protein